MILTDPYNILILVSKQPYIVVARISEVLVHSVIS